MRLGHDGRGHSSALHPRGLDPVRTEGHGRGQLPTTCGAMIQAVTFNAPKSPNLSRNDFHVNRPVGARLHSARGIPGHSGLLSAQPSGFGDTRPPHQSFLHGGRWGRPLSARRVREGEAGSSLTASVLRADSRLHVQ